MRLLNTILQIAIGAMQIVAAILMAAIIAYWATEIAFQSKAHGAAYCMSKSEARARWSRRHLYWHSADHCWDTHRGGRRRFATRLARAEDDDEKKPEKPKPEAQRFAQQKPLSPWIIYPSVVNPHSQIDRDFLKGVASTYTYRILDIDEITGKKPAADPPDECCWPELVRDKEGKITGVK
jgi:hypothetical protein